MSILSRKELEVLMNKQFEICVSIYMPTHRTGRDVRQDPIRLKNLLGRAGEKLEQAGFERREDMLRPARDLVEDSTFWTRRSDGLAMFIAPDEFEYHSLPYSFEEAAVVGQSYYLKPLVTLLSWDGEFHLLHLDRERLRLFRADEENLCELTFRDGPMSIDDIRKHESPERSVQFHTEAPGRAGRRYAIFHGQGVGTDDRRQKKEVLFFFQQAEKLITRYMRLRGTPLVLAGPDPLPSIYREANTYNGLLEKGIGKDLDNMGLDEIHSLALEAVRPVLEREKEKAAEQYFEREKDGLASGDLRDIVPASRQGRVEYMFLDPEFGQWGFLDPSTQKVTLRDNWQTGYVDLADFAAVNTLSADGKVFRADEHTPDELGPVAAVFRY